MKTWISRASKILAALALAVTTFAVNSACMCWMHQPELPDGAESLLKR